MKTLLNYIEEAQTKAFEKHGAFFAFSITQFDAARNPDVPTYTNLGAGLLCPKPNVEALKQELEQIHQQGMKQDLAENGKKAIIKRELANYECYYTGDASDAIEALEPYGITKEEVFEVFNERPVQNNC